MNDPMNPNMNNPNMNMDPNRRLKKVKRPVKRIVPQGQNMPASPRPAGQNPQSFGGQAAGNGAPQPAQPKIDAFNLDSYLDEQSNLPALADEDVMMSDFNRTQNMQPHFLDDDDLAAQQAAAYELPPYMNKKVLIIAGLALFFTGFILAKLLFAEQKVVRNGLEGVVVNSEVPRGRARCGVAEKTQGCVLYIMNPQRQELSASDFYDLAAQLTGRQRFVIDTGNMRYSNVKIRPGEIGQFNIPPLQ